MASEIRLPDVGEEIEDVTINHWTKNEGDKVVEGEVLLEVATDKVDTEVLSAFNGILLKRNFGEGEIVDVDAVLGFIGEAGEAAPEASEPTADPVAVAQTTEKIQAADAQAVETQVMDAPVKASPVAKRIAAEKGISLSQIAGTGPGGQVTKEDVLSQTVDPTTQALPNDSADVLSLSVRRLLAENNLNARQVAQGRALSTLTRYDVLSALAGREAGKEVTVEPRFLTPPDWHPSAPTTASSDATAEMSSAQTASAQAKAPIAAPVAAPVVATPSATADAETTRQELVTPSRIRAGVAKSVTQSAFTAPHVTTMHDVNMSAVIAHRKGHKAEFAKAGVRLTLTHYIIQAIVQALQAVPAANASWSDQGIVIKRYYNIGVAVSLPVDQYGTGGLIVPVLKNAESLNLMGIARQSNALIEKARNGSLSTADLRDGTFTLSNYGTSGSRFQTPIIVQPQVGILGTGAIEKRAVVVSNGSPLEANAGDYLTFQPVMTLGFSYDHRVLDGESADRFCVSLKQVLEGWS